MTKKYTIFISDVHLTPAHRQSTDWFLSLLHHDVFKQADSLYVLGDLFDAWLGDDDNSSFSQSIKQALYLASHDCPIFLMRGNRDFLLGSSFAKQAQVQIIADPTVIYLYQQLTLLMHGDILCTDDIPYQRARQRFTSHDFQKRVLRKPLWFRKLLAAYYRWHSRRYQRTVAEKITDIHHETMVHFMEEHGVTQLIHGHTHRPGVHWFQGASGFYKRITLSDWHQQPHALLYYNDHTQALCSLHDILCNKTSSKTTELLNLNQ